jgi:hypothetical protein
MRERLWRGTSAVALAGLFGLSFISPSAHAAQPSGAMVPITTIKSPSPDGLNGAVSIRVGNSAPFLVMLDTGSVGLRLFPSAPRRGVSTTPLTLPLPNGQVGKGVRGNKVMSIGRTATTQKVAVQYVSSTNPWIDGWQRQGVQGILGIGLRDSPIPNPLRFLPRAQGKSWSVKFERTGQGVLILGADLPADALMHFSLPSDVKSSDAQTRYWNDHAATGCWTFTAPSRLPREGIEHCVDTWFDSSLPIMRIMGRQFERVPLTANRALVPGTQVRVAPSGSAFAPVFMRAGDQGSRNATRVDASGRALINTGNSVFFDYTITYSAMTGDIYFATPAPKRSFNQ